MVRKRARDRQEASEPDCSTVRRLARLLLAGLAAVFAMQPLEAHLPGEPLRETTDVWALMSLHLGMRL